MYGFLCLAKAWNKSRTAAKIHTAPEKIFFGSPICLFKTSKPLAMAGDILCLTIVISIWSKYISFITKWRRASVWGADEKKTGWGRDQSVILWFNTREWQMLHCVYKGMKNVILWLQGNEKCHIVFPREWQMSHSVFKGIKNVIHYLQKCSLTFFGRSHDFGNT